MGTIQTRLAKIQMVRNTLKKATSIKKGVVKKKLVAELMMEGLTKRTANEIIQSFIDTEEAEIEIIEGNEVLIYAK